MSNTSKIGLLDNAGHSLQRGYEMFNKGRQNQDPLVLKEAIIWIHHGIELSIKQLLVQSNEYLIFDNIDKAVEKLVQLRRKSDLASANVLDLFDYSESVYTVGFGKLIDRAAILLNLQELAQGSILRDKIDALTSYRNKIVHFTVEVKLDEVITLLAELMEPFLALLEREVQNKEFSVKYIPLIRANAQAVSGAFLIKYKEAEDRIEKLLLNFNGQEVPGYLLGTDGIVKLPQFQKVDKEFKSRDINIDLLANTASENWVVEIKFSSSNSINIYSTVSNLRHYRQKMNLPNTQLWLAVLGTATKFDKELLRRHNIFFSTEKDITNLEYLLK